MIFRSVLEPKPLVSLQPNLPLNSPSESHSNPLYPQLPVGANSY